MFAVVSASGEEAGAAMDDMAIRTALAAALTASVADSASTSAVVSVDVIACNVSVDKAAVLDASGSDADDSSETLDVFVAPLDYILSLEADSS